MKTWTLIILTLAVICAASLSYFSKNAPTFLQHSLEQSLHKKVLVESIDYSFPTTFRLNNFRILDSDENFKDSPNFSARQIEVQASLFMFLSTQLDLQKVIVRDADIIIRKSHHKYSHFLSNNKELGSNVADSLQKDVIQQTSSKKSLAAIRIHSLRIKNSRVELADYDIQASGFSTQMTGINADIENIGLPLYKTKTQFELRGNIPQGRERALAQFEFRGQMELPALDGQAFLQLTDIHLPYFGPYLEPITQTRVQEGNMHLRDTVNIKNRVLENNIHVDVQNLFFDDLGPAQELFGFSARDLIKHFKDQRGVLSFQTRLLWDLDQPSKTNTNQIIRSAIESALKKKILSNVESVLEKTLKNLSKLSET